MDGFLGIARIMAPVKIGEGEHAAAARANLVQHFVRDAFPILGVPGEDADPAKLPAGDLPEPARPVRRLMALPDWVTTSRVVQPA
jgi:hypothetical protein